MFGKKQEASEPSFVSQETAKLEAALNAYIAAMVERHEVTLEAVRDGVPQLFGEGRNLVVLRVAHLRNLKQATAQRVGGSYNARAGVETR